MLKKLILIGLILIPHFALASTARSRFRSPDPDELGRVRRVGIGFTAGGVAPTLGLKAELHFTGQTSFSLGYGWGTEVQSVSSELTWYANTGRFRPFVSGGYAHWRPLVAGRSISMSSPSYLGEKFLSTLERLEGRFSEHLLTVGLGIQYRQLAGEWSGSSVYFQGLALNDLDDLVLQGALAMGFLYYF